ncbi:MAG: HlyD family efflux transporter periplasmic adaptor subunit [Planctomycetes bacterium]|nr:HlyD family efflux transporter periplasmic adaptor subunit [Planctomycetota bacterium]MBM4078182.1 HlyD family efflux transporter periplasmic adaptor subunit [Planctomycetota bacterium]
MRKIGLIACLCLLSSTAGLTCSRLGWRAAEAPGVIKVTPAKFERWLRERGVVEAAGTEMVYTTTEGEIVWFADQGTLVKAGDPVVKMANRVTEENYEEAKRYLIEREMFLTRSKLDFELQKRDLELTLKKKEADVRLARWELEDLKQRVTERQLKLMEIDAEIARYTMENARLESEAVQVLKASNLESEDLLKEKTAAHDKAKIEYERLRDLHEAAKAGPNKARIAVVEKRLEEAEHTLEDQKLANEETLREEEARIRINEAYLTRQKRYAETAKRRLDGLTVKAPIDGTVMLIEVYKGEGEDPSPIRIGETRGTGQDLLRMADMSSLVVRLRINEADVSMVKVGQKARIELVAFPERTYRGEVTEVSAFAEDKNIRLGRLEMSKEGLAGVNVVDVLVKITDPDERVRLDLTARVDITVESRENALCIPQSAVARRNGQWVCAVVDGRRHSPRSLKLGSVSEQHVVVLEGLREGEFIRARIND